MEKKTIAYLMVLGIIVFALSGTLLQTSEKDKTFNAPKGSSSSLNLPPSSLDSLYPPRTKQPVYLMRMLNLADLFTGIIVDLMEGDLPNVGPSFEKFKEEYEGVSKLVPEWEPIFPLAPVEELGKVLQAGEKGGIMAAYEKVGHVCHSCHVQYMAATQFRYHWQDFRKIKGKDPLTQEEIDFVQMMRNLNFSFSGATHNLKQGQMERAEKNLRAFQAQFESFKDTCQECHGTSERAYYVDDSILQEIKSLIKSLANDPPDQKKIANQVMTIGTESCFKCHLVHIPASAAKSQWQE